MPEQTSYRGPVTIHFKETIPDMAKAIPHAEIVNNQTLTIPYAQITPRIRSIDLTVNGDKHTFTEKTVQKVIGPNEQIIFGE